VTAKRTFNKAACKRLAAELRTEIGLQPMDALDPWALADLYGIRVISLSHLTVSSAARTHLTITRQDVFSGALIPAGNGAVILENDSHPLTRRRSTMGHELGHIVAEHKFETSLVSERGCRVADQTQEDEAAEIAGELLLPFEAAKQLARRNATDQEVALQFGVSPDLARWRMDATGARLIARRRVAANRRKSG
jgi:Zn-dependent peptidase ImmA (M78 family)